MSADQQQKDLLEGTAAIASHLGIKTRRAKHLIELGEIPHFKLVGRICSTRSKLDAWLKERS